MGKNREPSVTGRVNLERYTLDPERESLSLKLPPPLLWTGGPLHLPFLVLVSFVRPGTTIQCAGTLTVKRSHKESKLLSAIAAAFRAFAETSGKYAR